MAPEYAMHGQFSVKSDVFSFGVLLLEIVSGQKNNCFRNGEHVEDLLSYVSKITICSSIEGKTSNTCLFEIRIILQLLTLHVHV